MGMTWTWGVCSCAGAEVAAHTLGTVIIVMLRPGRTSFWWFENSILMLFISSSGGEDARGLPLSCGVSNSSLRGGQGGAKGSKVGAASIAS